MGKFFNWLILGKNIKRNERSQEKKKLH